jgi:hypothetical protein
LEMNDIITPNLIEQAGEVFNLYPEYRLDLLRAMKENLFLVLKYRAILGGIANALVNNNETRFNNSIVAYKNIYDKFKSLGLYYPE